jgi:hypothetical protein
VSALSHPETIEQRLEYLRRRGNPGVAPLWADALPAPEALDAVKDLPEPWARLVEAKALSELGRAEEALAALECMGEDLPRGLARFREELSSRVRSQSVVPTEGQKTAAEEARKEALRQWLDRVRQWRQNDKS